MTDTDTAAADPQPRDLEHFLGEQVRRVFDAELGKLTILREGDETHPHFRVLCAEHGWNAHGPIEADVQAATRTHVSQAHPAGQLAFGMFAVLRRYHAAHTAAERGAGGPLATAQALNLRAFRRCLASLASGFATEPGYNLGWTPRD